MFRVISRHHRERLNYRQLQSRHVAAVKFARQAIERQTKSRNPMMFGGMRYHSLSEGNKAACVLVD